MNKILLLTLLACTIFTSQAATLPEALEQIHSALPGYLRQHSLTLQEAVKTNQSACLPCYAVFGYLQNMNITLWFDRTSALIDWVCDEFNLLGPGTCEGAISEMGPVVIQSIRNRYLNPLHFCPSIGVCPEVFENIDIENVVDKILEGAPAVYPARHVPTQKNILKFMHITDLHYDFGYQVGSYAQCAEPTCCRASSTLKKGTTSAGAGYWGNLGDCDLPFHTIEAMVSYLNRTIADDLDFVLWTGDNTNHFIWEQTQEQNINSTLQITELFQRELPNLKVFPIMGNHESFPCNLYEYGTDREKILKSSFADAWKPWIGEAAAKQFLDNGFYSTLINKGGQIVRLLAINTQAGNPMNFYLIKNPTDPGHQLLWMEEQLILSEKLGEKVYIIGHIPSDAMTEDWAEVYNALIERYQSVVIGQFYGHTHQDQLKVYKNQNSTTINNVAFIAPSVTTYGNQNPSFRIFEVDKKTMLPVNYIQYRLNLTKYNQQGTQDITQVDFDIAYNFNQEYGFTDMSKLSNFETLSQQLLTNLTTFTNYQNNYYAGANNQVYTSTSQGVYCDLNATPSLVGLCNGSYSPSLMEILIGQWFTIASHKGEK